MANTENGRAPVDLEHIIAYFKTCYWHNCSTWRTGRHNNNNNCPPLKRQNITMTPELEREIEARMALAILAAVD